MVKYMFFMAIIVSLLVAAPFGAALAQDSDSSIITPDPADKTLKDVGKFKGSLGGMFGAWMDSGKGWNRPPYVSEDDVSTGGSCGTGPDRNPFGPTPDGPGC
jgi:hypothetical protein